MEILNFTNCDRQSFDEGSIRTHDAGRTWCMFANRPESSKTFWMPPENLIEAGLPKVVQHELCWDGGYGVLYTGELDVKAAASEIVKRLIEMVEDNLSEEEDALSDRREAIEKHLEK